MNKINIAFLFKGGYWWRLDPIEKTSSNEVLIATAKEDFLTKQTFLYFSGKVIRSEDIMAIDITYTEGTEEPYYYAAVFNDIVCGVGTTVKEAERNAWYPEPASFKIYKITRDTYNDIMLNGWDDRDNFKIENGILSRV